MSSNYIRTLRQLISNYLFYTRSDQVISYEVNGINRTQQFPPLKPTQDASHATQVVGCTWVWICCTASCRTGSKLHPLRLVDSSIHVLARELTSVSALHSHMASGERYTYLRRYSLAWNQIRRMRTLRWQRCCRRHRRSSDISRDKPTLIADAQLAGQARDATL